jgi:hypothetical protein
MQQTPLFVTAICVKVEQPELRLPIPNCDVHQKKVFLIAICNRKLEANVRDGTKADVEREKSFLSIVPPSTLI